LTKQTWLNTAKFVFWKPHKRSNKLHIQLRIVGYQYCIERLFDQSPVNPGDRLKLAENAILEATPFGAKSGNHRDFVVVLHFNQNTKSRKVADLLVRKINISGFEKGYVAGRSGSIIMSTEIENIMERVKAGMPVSEKCERPHPDSTGEIVSLTNAFRIRSLLRRITRVISTARQW